MIARIRHANRLVALLSAGFAILPMTAFAGRVHTDHTPPIAISPPKVVRDHRGDNSVTFVNVKLPPCIAASGPCRTGPTRPTKGDPSVPIIRDHR